MISWIVSIVTSTDEASLISFFLISSLETGKYHLQEVDNGKTFGSPMNISNSPDAHSLGPRIAPDQGNNVYISWVVIDKKTGLKQVLFRASNDNGQTFGNPVMLNSTTTTGR